MNQIEEPKQEKLTALEIALAPNLRRQRANMFAAMVIQALGDLLEPDELHPQKRWDAAAILFKLFHQDGFDAITDYDRVQAGLPRRGDLGWTEHELHIMENARTLALLAPIKPMIFPTSVGEQLDLKP